MAETTLIPILSSRFTYVPENKSLVIEASTLGWAPGTDRLFRLFDDACDIGLAVESVRTSRVERFFLQSQDAEGWVLRPVNLDLFATGIKVVIFNT